MISVRWILSDS